MLSMDIYERNINAAVRRWDDDHIVTKASLLDLNHNMRVEIKVRLSDRTIVDASAQMTKTPFTICDQTAQFVQNIVGLKIERGITKKLSQILGRSEGCTHLYELAVEAVRLSSNVILGFATGDEEWRRRKLSDEEFIQRAKEFLKNSCLPFREEELKPQNVDGREQIEPV
ncbi:MAG: DUF2889 domain-containing protein [bacterium]